MVAKKSLDEVNIVDALLCDVQNLHSDVFSLRSLRLTKQKLHNRYDREGIGLLTKSFPRLAKALDRALSGEVPLNSVGWRKLSGSQLPRFLGELFQCVFSLDGWVLPTPCVKCIKSLRQILYLFYKYELPYTTDQEQAVLESFIKTDDELYTYNIKCEAAASCDIASLGVSPSVCRKANQAGINLQEVVRKAQALLSEVFATFDHRDIYPRHGPGSVSTKEIGPEKYMFRVISPRIVDTYPLDEYFYACLGAVCDCYKEMQNLRFGESSAKVVLVPKDSRGPRLISEESLDYQWIQQGLHRAIVEHVEHHEKTMYNVFFTDQTPNQLAALWGSTRTVQVRTSGPSIGKTADLKCGRYATLDLKDASDRVSLGLVRLLFPEPLVTALMNCRSLSTELPTGEIRSLNKYAPMGSALCFPVLALCIWAILTSGASDADARESIHVFGDDVIVQAAEAANAIKLLESFGLLVNRDKSCTTGFFRESCGVDAYFGVNITPVRIRTKWTSSRCADVYSSWIAYANSMFERQYWSAYDYISEQIFTQYGEVPEANLGLSCPSLPIVPERYRPSRYRISKDLQSKEYYVFDIESRTIDKEIRGWSMLLRYFVEAVGRPKFSKNHSWQMPPTRLGDFDRPAFSVRSYTPRDAIKLVRRWRRPYGPENKVKRREVELPLVAPWLLCSGERYNAQQDLVQSILTNARTTAIAPDGTATVSDEFTRAHDDKLSCKL